MDPDSRQWSMNDGRNSHGGKTINYQLNKNNNPMYGNNNNNGSRQNVRNNRFGDPEVLTSLKQKVDKKSGDLLPIYKGYVEINGSLFSIEVSNCNKENADGIERKWCKVTKKVKRSNSQQKF